MSSKNKYGKFKKKDYVRIVENVVYYLCDKFGYRIKPYVFETELPPNALMMFTHKPGAYAIVYDYKQFKEKFGCRDFETQEAYAAAIAAHEMRHYYQHRQMIAKKPREKAEIIARWRENEDDPKCWEDSYSILDFCLQPLELDAVLYEYVFGAEIFEKALIQVICNEEHFDALEKLYVEYFGETDPDIFNDEIRNLLRNKA